MRDHLGSLFLHDGSGRLRIATAGAALCFWIFLFPLVIRTQEKPPAAAVSKLPEDPGKSMVLKLCGGCHNPEIVAVRGRSAEEWEATLVNMVQRGAKGSDDEFYEVWDYLCKNFPKPAAADKPDARSGSATSLGDGEKINVNTAKAKALETGLQISAKEAEAIVDFREKNGKFKSFEDLKKVSGLDAKKLEEKKDQVVF